MINTDVSATFSPPCTAGAFRPSAAGGRVDRINDTRCDSMWPASNLIDHVRIWQNAAAGHSTGCSPTAMPTAEYIEANAGLFGADEYPELFPARPAVAAR